MREMEHSATIMMAMKIKMDIAVTLCKQPAEKARYVHATQAFYSLWKRRNPW